MSEFTFEQAILTLRHAILFPADIERLRPSPGQALHLLETLHAARAEELDRLRACEELVEQWRMDKCGGFHEADGLPWTPCGMCGERRDKPGRNCAFPHADELEAALHGSERAERGNAVAQAMSDASLSAPSSGQPEEE